MDSIGIEATSASSGDVHSLSMPTVLGMLILVLILGVISSRQLRGRGIGVQHLFLKIALKRATQDLIGFVRSLDIDEMKLVMTEAPTKGEVLTFDLSSLPGFPSEGKTVNGMVEKVKSLGGNNNNFLVTVALGLPASTDDISDHLVAYLRHLHA